MVPRSVCGDRGGNAAGDGTCECARFDCQGDDRAYMVNDPDCPQYEAPNTVPCRCLIESSDSTRCFVTSEANCPSSSA
jgi:hypothetical protein